MTDVRGSRIVRLIEDPEVTGDLLLVALAIAAKYDFGLDYGRDLSQLAGLLWGTTASGWRMRMALKDDMRTYRPPRVEGRACVAPMVRRGGECGRSSTACGYLTDWDTGEMTYVGACSRHRAWFFARRDTNWRARPTNPPLPAANHGGLLIPYFPRIDWRSFWRRLDPSWVEHPEEKPWPKPDLALVLGDDEGGLASAPLLSVVPSGGAG